MEHLWERRVVDANQLELGQRIAEGRRLADRTQGELATAVGLQRTALTKIESGNQRVEALTLASLARALKLPLRWFLSEDPPVLQSRREGSSAALASPPVDLLLERLVAAGDQVEEWVPAPDQTPARSLGDVSDAVDLAAEARRRLGNPGDPILELSRACDELGLWVFCIDVEDEAFDGASVALRHWSLALINGRAESGRRRFTVAHELGHALSQDEYVVHRGELHDGETERFIDVFAGHFLLPDSAVARRWRELDGKEDARSALLRIVAEYRLSWSAATARARQADVIAQDVEQELRSRVPRGGEFMEQGIFLTAELPSPSVPPSYSKAVLGAYRKRHLGAERAVEMLFGALDESQLPERDDLPLTEFVKDLEGLG